MGKTEEAVVCVDMFNKSIAAYLTYNLPIKEVGEEFIKRLLRVSVDLELIKGIGGCTWDKKTRVLTTPKYIEGAEKKKLEDAAWYQKYYGVINLNGSKKYNKKETFLAPENFYTLGDDHTYTTLNERPGTYTGSPGAAMIDLVKNRPRPSNIDLTNGSDNDRVMSNVTSMTNLAGTAAYSKDKLMEMLQNARISRRSSVKGSAPKGNGKLHHKSSDNGGSLSGNDDSNLSSTSSEEEKYEIDVASSG